MIKGQRKGRNPIVPFSSTEGVRRFRSLAFRPAHLRLLEAFQPQQTPVLCAVASAVTTLNASLDPDQKLYQHTFLNAATDRIKTRRKIEAIGNPLAGLTLAQLEQILKARVPGLRLGKLAPGAQPLRRALRAYQKTGRRRLIANFATAAIWGGRGGHFSPLGGYHSSSDSVLVLDVAIHRTPWYWCPVERLAQALGEIDPETNEPRGCLVVSL